MTWEKLAIKFNFPAVEGRLVKVRGRYPRGLLGIFPRLQEIWSLISRKVMLSLCNTMVAEENFENLTDGKFTL